MSISITKLRYNHQEPNNLIILSSQVQRTELLYKFAHKLIINHDLTRSLVSFQANKKTPFYGWLKYKEAFSSDFVQYILEEFKPSNDSIPRALDPFAGIGTTLTNATKAGWKATGIELMPVGIAAIKARLLADTVDIKSFQFYLNQLENFSFDSIKSKYRFSHLRITEKAFPEKNEKAISAYMTFVKRIKDEKVRFLFWFACFSILEDVSFTRKDGQYLRWDTRADRSLKSKFNKGTVHDFRKLIINKLYIMNEDIKNRNGGTFSNNVEIIEGSCLTKLAQLPDASFDLVITSPPYCNRYDYTRTYALELAFMDYNEDAVKNLRQSLLSATVENKTKREQLSREYRNRDQEQIYNDSVRAFNNQKALHEVLDLLYEAREKGELNNNNIPSMVENYFFEMNLVINELARVIAPGGHVVMVNDNVQYNGEEVPVDLILSDFAISAGLSVDCIWILPKGKGNSSQQMGIHGRNEIRKCVYVWSKPSN